MDAQTQDAASARQWYNRLSTIYDSLSDSSERPARLAGLRLLNAQPGERVLELGCGTGHALVSLALAVGDEGKVVGIDVSDRMVDEAQARLAEEGLTSRVELRVEDARTAQLGQACFDAAFLSFTLELFPQADIEALLSRIHQALKPKGRLCVVGLSEKENPGVGGRLYAKLHQWFPRYIDCRPIASDTLVQQAGFLLETSEPFSLWGIPGLAVLAKK